MAKKTHPHLPNPWELAQESWSLFLRIFWSLVKIFLINIGVAVGAMVLAALIGGLIFFLFGGHIDLLVGILLGLLVLILVVFLVYVSLWVQAAYIVVLHNGKEKITARETMKQARVFVKPLFLTGLLSAFFVLGGYLLLLIPGIIMGIWFSLNQFIVVTEKKQNLLALHTSREYLRGQFFPFLWRMIAMYLPVIILGLLAGVVPTDEGKRGFQALLQLVSFVAGPFYLVYTYVLFQHLSRLAKVKPTTVSGTAKKQYYLLAGGGYLLLILLIFIAAAR